MGSVARLANYGQRDVGAARVTPAQARRLRHKHGRVEALLVLGYSPAARETERVQRARLRRAARRSA